MVRRNIILFSFEEISAVVSNTCTEAGWLSNEINQIVGSLGWENK